MQIIDTFSGIGGFSLAGRWMGWRTIQFCEIDKFCQRVLKYHWPDVPLHDDIKTLTAQQIFNNGLYDKKEPTILVGGIPCQPWSAAGKRRGTEDDRNLWPQSIELVKSLATDYIVFENVFGFVNWSGGIVFREVISDLENEGYEVQPFIIPACAVNAPHRRDRVWIIAHAKDLRDRRNAGAMGETQIKSFRKNDGSEFNCKSQDEPTPDAEGSCCEGQCEQGQGQREFGGCDCWDATDTTSSGRWKIGGQREPRLTNSKSQITDWSDFPTQPPLRGIYDGFSEVMDRNWNITQKYYATIREICGNKDLRNLRETVSTQAFWESFGGLHEVLNQEILLKVLQSIEESAGIIKGVQSDGTSEIFEKVVPNLRKHIKSSDSSHKRKLEEQLGEQYSDFVCIVPYEIALAVMEIQSQYKTFYSKLRNESIKAYGNAVVPQVVYQIFKAIEKYELLKTKLATEG